MQNFRRYLIFCSAAHDYFIYTHGSMIITVSTHVQISLTGCRFNSAFSL